MEDVNNVVNLVEEKVEESKKTQNVLATSAGNEMARHGRHTEFVNGRCLSLSVDPVDRLLTLLTVC